MEHAKKMILVPQTSVERLQNTFARDKIKSVQTPGSVTSRLDAEMNDILNSSTCKDEREKWSLYRQVLQRYLHFKEGETVGQEERSKKKYKQVSKNFLKNEVMRWWMRRRMRTRTSSIVCQKSSEKKLWESPQAFASPWGNSLEQRWRCTHRWRSCTRSQYYRLDKPCDER